MADDKKPVPMVQFFIPKSMCKDLADVIEVGVEGLGDNKTISKLCTLAHELREAADEK